MTKHSAGTTTARRGFAAASHGRSLPAIVIEAEGEQVPEQPFAEGACEAIDPDLRYRMISEAAYRRYADRGYEDGYDVEDWLEAEADVDHLLLGRGTLQAQGSGA
jgi:hypothetical protein